MLLAIYQVRMESLLRVPGFYPPISDLWERHRQYFVPVSNYSTYLYQIISSLWGRPYSGCKGKPAVVLVM